MSPRERTVSLVLTVLLFVGLVLWALGAPLIDGVGEQPTPSSPAPQPTVTQNVSPSIIAKGSQQQQFKLETLPVRPEPTPSATPSPTPKPTAKPKPKTAPRQPRPVTRRGGWDQGHIRGPAKWYATGRDGLYAAAGPALRGVLGSDWRGEHVLVCKQHSRRCVEVVLNDWCQCKAGNPNTLIDLSDEAFGYLSPLSRGRIIVIVAW